MIIALGGLPGTGKSTLAAGIAEQLKAIVIDKDRIRPALFTPAAVNYTRRQDDFCYQIMLDTAGYLLAEDPARIVILDGRTLSRAYQVRQLRDHAAHLDQPLTIIECVCPGGTAEARLRADHLANVHPAANRTISLYQQLKAGADPINPPKFVIDTSRDPAAVLQDCMHKLRARHIDRRNLISPARQFLDRRDYKVPT